MNGFIKTIAADKIIRLGAMISVGLLFLTLIYIGFFYRFLPPVVPIYNQMPWGEDRLGGKLELFLLPIIALAVFISNTIFSSYLYERMPLISRALAITSFLISLITTIFVFRTVQLLL